jgi:hypothetical protein
VNSSASSAEAEKRFFDAWFFDTDFVFTLSLSLVHNSVVVVIAPLSCRLHTAWLRV